MGRAVRGGCEHSLVEEFADRPALLLDFGDGPQRTLLLKWPEAKELMHLVDPVDEALARRIQAAADRSEPYSLHDEAERATVVATLDRPNELLPPRLAQVLDILRGG